MSKISRRNSGLLLCGSSVITLFMASSVLAQTTSPATSPDAQPDASTVEEVVVTGFRASLAASQDIKRNASSIVDAVSAEDVGKFPDNNVAEALQRITGVAIDRSGGEGQFITVRGLGPEFNTVLLNGRTIATENPGREFSFDVLSSDIIQRAEVYKSVDPALQSGGIGSVVNISTARPLDRKAGFSFNGSAAGNYEDLRGKSGYEATGVGSWSNGTFGALLGLAYSKRQTQIDTNVTNGFQLRDGSVNSGDVIINAPETASGLTSANIVPSPRMRVQQQNIFGRDLQDRKRLTVNGALQYAPTDRLKMSVDGLYSKFDINSMDRQFSGFFSPPYINPVIDANGTVTSFSRPGVDFNNRNPAIASQVGVSQDDNILHSNNRHAKTYALGANIEFKPTDKLKIVADVSWSKATRDFTNPFVVLGALAPTSPLITLPTGGGISTISNLTGLTDKSIQRLHYVSVSRAHVGDEVWEYRLNGDWDIDAGPLRKISFGGLFTDRTKIQNAYDTGVTGVECTYCGYNVAFDTSILSNYSLGGFLKGVEGSSSVPASILTASIADAFRVLNDPANIANPARGNNSGSTSTAALLAKLNGGGLDPLYGIYTPAFNPGASFQVDEKVYETYLNTSWGGDFDGELPWSANAGFRVAFTKVVSHGFDRPALTFRETPGDTQLLVDYGPVSPLAVSNDYVNFLPAANLKIEPAQDMVLRFGYAKTVTRPTLTALGVSNTYGGRSNAPTSGGGNPNLKAFTSDNFDVSYEWYFDRVSYFSVAAFYKKLGNFIETSTLPVVHPVIFPAGNGGRTQDQTVNVTFQDTRQRNGLSGDLEGVEIALQKTFTSGWLNGFGGIVNYTHVKSHRTNAPVGDLGFNGFTPNTVNVTGFYERGPLSARVSYNWRDEFLVQGQADQSEPRQREAFGQVDFSLGYDVTENFQVFAEGVNVLEEDKRDFSRYQNRILTYERTGPRYTFGVRAKF